jgi:predicted metal-binding membrane protein
MTDRADQGFPYLPPAAARLGHIFARPQLIAGLCVIVLTGLGWLGLDIMAAGEGGLNGTFNALCSAAFAGNQLGAGSVALIGGMWAAMVLAMMLPSAGPMILTYAEIADTAARKGEPIVSPLTLAAGYTVVWLGFAVVATVTQFVLARLALLDTSMTAASGLFAGAIFITAGAYQFSALKRACLKQCRQPFPFFFTNWRTTRRGIFRLGLEQGLFCVGCCWAMMLVMFAVGVMNIVWMASLGIVMTVEKFGSGKWFSRAVGIVLIALGIGFVLAAFAAHWPGRPI